MNILLVVFTGGMFQIGQGRLTTQEPLSTYFPETFFAILLVNFEFSEGRALEGIYFEVKWMPLDGRFLHLGWRFLIIKIIIGGALLPYSIYLIIFNEVKKHTEVVEQIRKKNP